MQRLILRNAGGVRYPQKIINRSYLGEKVGPWLVIANYRIAHNVVVVVVFYFILSRLLYQAFHYK